MDASGSPRGISVVENRLTSQGSDDGHAMSRISQHSKQQALDRIPEMKDIRTRHRSIQDNISEIQSRASQVLQDQARDLVKAFKRKLDDLAAELEKERRKNESGAIQWITKCRKLQEEADWLKEHSNKLEDDQVALQKDLRRVRKQLHSQEEDRQFLIKQLVAAKKENSRLREQAAKFKQQAVENKRPESAQSNTQRPGSAISDAQLQLQRGMPSQTEQRYKSVVSKLKRLLNEEQSKARSWYAAYNQELQNKSDLQIFLEQAIRDAASHQEHNENAGSMLEQAALQGGAPKDLAHETLTGAERVNVLQKLVSDKKMQQLLFDRVFPRQTRDSRTLDEHLGVTAFTRSKGSSPHRSRSSTPNPRVGGLTTLEALSHALHETVSNAQSPSPATPGVDAFLERWDPTHSKGTPPKQATSSSPDKRRYFPRVGNMPAGPKGGSGITKRASKKLTL